MNSNRVTYSALILLFITTTATAYVAPSTLRKFVPVLEKAKLQAPSSNNAVHDLIDFASSYFHLQGNRYMQFRMKGDRRRSELRQMKTNGSKAQWSVKGLHRMTARVAIPTPEPEMNEITFLQVHCTKAPALRISWFKKFTRNGKSCKNCIIATVRDGTGNKDINKYILGQWSSATTEYKVRLWGSKLDIWMHGSKVLNAEPMNFWDKYSCYFKAGVYLQNPTSSSVFARTKFDTLSW